MKASELRGQSPTELHDQLREKRAELAELQFNHNLNPVENPARIRGIRKDIARILTVLAQQQQQQPITQ
ncbi:MAG: 50S ribosomal protein L29 [Bacteroidia bacterium]|nr:50S ribosomal protein L29 [Bacteroidia bacterium]